MLNQCWLASLWFTTCTLCLPCLCTIKETDNLTNQLIMQLSTFWMMSEYSLSPVSNSDLFATTISYCSWNNHDLVVNLNIDSTIIQLCERMLVKLLGSIIDFFFSSFTKLFILFLQQDYNCFIIQIFTHHCRCYFQMMQGGNDELRILESNLPYGCTR